MVTTKKVPGKKSYQFETLFSRTFFLAPVWFYTKKSSYKWKCMIHNSRFFFSSDLFSSGLFSWDLISWHFIGSPHTILGKKVPEIQNTGLYFQWHFFQGLNKIRTFFQNFYFQVFFPETFFPGTFLHTFKTLETILRISITFIHSSFVAKYFNIISM